MTLDQIAIKHGTDKSSAHHGYCETYELYFTPLREKKLTLLELGFGGYQYPDRGGAGAKTWAEYFPKAEVYTIDNNYKNPLPHPRIHFNQVSQSDDVALSNLILHICSPDIIIDDASHTSPLTIRSFEILFPLLKSGGIYVVEDTHASYWTEHGFDGGWHENTTMNYFKRLTDSLNHENNGLQSLGIKAIHFWRQQIFILKA